MEADAKRYEKMIYNRCGDSGLLLPAVSYGLWHNFGDISSLDDMEKLCWCAFNNGITHFDLANNYGPEPGAAERNFGLILKRGLGKYRDELIISTKAGYTMWDGPYGDWGSRKYLMASLNQSLERMSLDYVDIFYHHRPDPKTPMKETALALADIVRQGKALYIGLSNYSGPQMEEMKKWLDLYQVPYVINQNRYNLLDRVIEGNGLYEQTIKDQIGLITFSPLAQGQLTNRYLDGIPKDSRIGHDPRFLKEEMLTAQKMEAIGRLNDLALSLNMTLAQLSLKWLLQKQAVTSVLIGASKPTQILDNIHTVFLPDMDEQTLAAIDETLKDIIIR